MQKNMRLVFMALLQLVVLQTMAQTYKVSYLRSFNDNVPPNQDTIVVFTNANRTALLSERILSSTAKFPYETIYIDWEDGRLLYRNTHLQEGSDIATVDSLILDKYDYTLTDEYRTILGYKCQKALTSINSNTIEVWFTKDLGVMGGPTEIGQKLGLVLELVRNGNTKTTAQHIEQVDQVPSIALQPDFEMLLTAMDYQDQLWKSRFVQIPIFRNELIRFGDIVSDSVMRFAHGTVILKKVKVPEINAESQIFIDLVEKSNGDAYDRTGSVFLIAEDQKTTFLDGMQGGMETIPYYLDEGGAKYPGMVRTDGFSPVFELMRFFTPFGVSHFNDRLQLKGKTWQDSVSYRQDISEFADVLSDREVYIGVYIGNYDNGGHKVSLEMTIHRGESNYAKEQKIMPLFNTTNVMEMGGQTYRRFSNMRRDWNLPLS